MQQTLHFRLFVIAIFLMVFAIKVNAKCSICASLMIGGGFILLIIGIIAAIKHHKRIKRLKNKGL